jgi:multicomponent Na+:H+ antiporter subunit C
VELLLAVTVGVLYAAGLYLLLRRSLMQVILGLALLTNGANLLIFTAAGIVRANPPLVPEGRTALEGTFADPLPQALILTAIVIGFALQAFAMALAYRVYTSTGSDDVDLLRRTEGDQLAERPEPPTASTAAHLDEREPVLQLGGERG